MINATIKNLKLKLVEGVQMPESIRNEKGEFVKTGKKLNYFGYTLLTDDEFREKLYFVSSKDFSKYEDQNVDVLLNISFDDFSKKIRSRLETINPTQ